MEHKRGRLRECTQIQKINTSNKTKLKSKQPFSKRCAKCGHYGRTGAKKGDFPQKEKRKGEKGA